MPDLDSKPSSADNSDREGVSVVTAPWRHSRAHQAAGYLRGCPGYDDCTAAVLAVTFIRIYTIFDRRPGTFHGVGNNTSGIRITAKTG